MFLGRREFLEELLKNSNHRHVSGPRPGFEQIRAAMEKVRGEPWESLLKRRGDWSRDMALYLMRENGHSLRAAAAAVNIKRAPTAGMAIQRFEQRMCADKAVRKAVEQVTQMLA
jgi:hypothetical protein